ncbi:MAG: sorting domain protein [Proteobacteria bacterium]|nr:sorting domain protein [Pseudomonadota bacterium]
MKVQSTLLRSLVAAAAVFATQAAHAAITDDFAVDAGGWRAIDLAGSGDYGMVISTFSVTHHASGGAPGGHISASDPSVYSFYFDAPGKYTGNLSAYAGGTLSFDTYYTPNEASSAWRDDADVVLSSGSTHLVWQAANNPGANWTHVSVALDAAQGWKIGSIHGSQATAADLANALSNLTALRIRGEYVSGVIETTGLDNVSLAPVPEPETWAMLLAGLGIVGTLGRRKHRASR